MKRLIRSNNGDCQLQGGTVKGYFKKAVNLIKKAGRVALTMPLLSSLVGGCGKPPHAGECHSYNNTTVTINRETDGEIARIKEIEKKPEGAGILLTEPLIDFINETHALSSEGLPEDVNVTQAPEQCFRGRYAAYVTYERVHAEGSTVTTPGVNMVDADKGIYIPEAMGLSNVETLNHEIGHLQPGGGSAAGHRLGCTWETIAEINKSEQILNGFVVFASQLENPSDIIKWASHANRFRFGLSQMPSALQAIDRAQLSDEDLVRAEEDSDFEIDIVFGTSLAGNTHRCADVYFFQLLSEYGADFSRIRTEVIDTDANYNTLHDILYRILGAFIRKYAVVDFPLADIDLTMKMAFLEELYGNFEGYIAGEFFRANSFVSSTHRYEYTHGFEGMNCMATRRRRLSDEIEHCWGEDLCDTIGASHRREVVEAHFCCIDIERAEDGVSFQNFRKWVVEAHGTLYTTDYGDPNIHDTKWSSVVFLDVDTKTEMGLDESCR